MTRGMKNNNPGNIRRSATKWAFMRSIQSDKKFCQFQTMEFGIRAFFLLMRTYRYKYGLKTPKQIIKRYAPASENDVTAYLSFLSSHFLSEDLDLNTDVLYCIFAKYVFLYESNFRCSVDYLKTLMDKCNCHVINPYKEYVQESIF